MSLLRSDLIYRHIPIHVISSEENRSRARKWGAKSFMVRQDDRKSLDRLFEDIIAFSDKTTKQVLVVGENPEYVSLLEKICPDNTIQIEIVTTAIRSIERLKQKEFDCIVLDYDAENSGE